MYLAFDDPGAFFLLGPPFRIEKLALPGVRQLERHMFKELVFNRVSNDLGFTRKLRVFRGFVKYREGDHVCRVAVEPVIGRPLVRGHRNAPFAWKSPYQAEPTRFVNAMRLGIALLKA